MAERKQIKGSKITVKQRKSEVGYKRPPKEAQYKPGQSGNPAGPPKRRTQLWVYFCRYMGMMDAELDKLKKKEMTQAQQTALKLVQNMKKGIGSGSEHLARHVFDREEGKATEYLVIENENTLTDEECQEIRDVLLKNHADEPANPEYGQGDPAIQAAAGNEGLSSQPG